MIPYQFTANRAVSLYMNKLYIITCFVGILSSCINRHNISQIQSTSESEDSVIVCAVETPPSFPGGGDSLTRCIRNMIDESGTHHQGRPIYQFVVETDGSISEVVVRKENGATEEAITFGKSLIERLPKFSPATLSGNPIRCLCLLPIDFDYYQSMGNSNTK